MHFNYYLHKLEHSEHKRPLFGHILVSASYLALDEVRYTTKFLCYNNVHPMRTSSKENESILTAQVLRTDFLTAHFRV